MNELKLAHPLKKSIKSRVVLRVSALIAVAMFIILALVSLLVYKHMSKQIITLLENNSDAVGQRIERRISYLVDNSVLLTKNEFIVNALIDAKNRQNYLRPIVNNFMDGKDVISLSVLDFDGTPIFQTQEKIPRYESPKELRASLALGHDVIYLDAQTNNMILIAPIQYYATTQGAIVVLFDFQDILKYSKPEDNTIYMKVFQKGKELFSYQYEKEQSYQKYLLPPLKSMPLVTKLGLEIELGVLEDVYFAPVKDTMLRLAVIGFIFILFGILASVILANSITKPILTLYQRIKQSSAGNDVLCSPVGTDDELEALAKVFDEYTLALQYQAKHDFLTSLPNRVLFMDRLEQSLRNARRESSIVAVLFIDLDHFKEVNDSFGHSVGDKLLKNISTLLESSVRETDSVARFGGDEFTVLIENIESENTIIDLIQNIMNKLKEVQIIDSYQFYISCSIGISLFPQNAATSEEMLQNADAAMYKAKDEGRNTYQFYAEDMTQRAYERLTLETKLREAIINEEFVVFYQPQIDMRTKRMVGMEALVRWIKDGTFVATPDQFIPLAEDTRLIVDLDRFVMRSAIGQFAQWIRDGYNPGVLSLNMSMIHLNQKDFIQTLTKMLHEAGVSETNIELEVTETQIMKNPEQTIEILREIKELGFSIAVDDFGTGHSSLSYLKKLPVNRLKIDQSFVHDIPNDKDDMELTRAIIAMATSLNLKVIAEGVETQEQAEFLQEHGCYEAQGYLYSKPLPHKEITKLLITPL
ncbi:EAL domain-containing protein [Sulfurimonas sp.]|uniref:EAL domain-containing protein n=1 Tax=Sulfurimonas sp. TaxID=2022749 RepID=UPI0025FECA2E|nr:EAL domain-containing protein [Sulfurimonas sp.]MBW6489037.1 EAL domain-containing protein [Sulfurimonas sp.]